MNNERRKHIQAAVKMIEEAIGKYTDARTILEGCAEEEQEAFDCLPESLRHSERGETMEEHIGYLDAAIEELANIT